MKSIAKTFACFLVGFAGLMFTAVAVAGGNGSGNEPPKKDTKESAVSICTVIPWACTLIGPQSNGSGNEPPSGNE